MAINETTPADEPGEPATVDATQSASLDQLAGTNSAYAVLMAKSATPASFVVYNRSRREHLSSSLQRATTTEGWKGRKFHALDDAVHHLKEIVHEPDRP